MKNTSYHEFPSAMYYAGNISVGTNISANSTTPSWFGPVCDFSTTTFKEVLLAVFLLCVMCANLVGNSLVVFACVRSSQLKKRKNTYFIVSLAFSDMGYAVTVLPMIVSVKLHVGAFCHSLAACYFIQLLDVVTNVSSIVILFIIGIDRFIAITMPFRYQDIVTAKSAKAMIAGCWIFAVLWSFLGIFRWGEITKEDGYDSIWSIVVMPQRKVCARSYNSYYFAASYIGVYIISLIVMTITYGLVLCVAFTQIKEIERTTVDADAFNSPTDGKKKGKAQANRKRQKEWKATKSVATVYVCFFICWFPLFVINMIFLYDAKVLRQMNPDVRDFVIYTFIDILPSFNTMLNPIIYSFANNHFREGFKAAFKRCLGRNLNRTKSESTFARSITRIMSVSSINVDVATTGNPPARAQNEFVRQDPNISLSTINERNTNLLAPQPAQTTPESKGKSHTVGLENPTFDPS